MSACGHDGLVPRKIEGTANVVKERMEHRRIARDAWRARLEAGWGRDNQQTPQLPRDASLFFRDGRSPRAFLFSRGGRGHAQTQAARFGNWQAAAAFLPALFYRFRVPLSSRFFWRSGQHIGFAASQCVQSTHNLKAQPSFEDCCAKNKSGYSRIRATDRKKRSEAVTNGQGRQGREDL